MTAIWHSVSCVCEKCVKADENHISSYPAAWNVPLFEEGEEDATTT